MSRSISTSSLFLPDDDDVPCYTPKHPYNTRLSASRRAAILPLQRELVLLPANVARRRKVSHRIPGIAHLLLALLGLAAVAAYLHGSNGRDITDLRRLRMELDSIKDLLQREEQAKLEVARELVGDFKNSGVIFVSSNKVQPIQTNHVEAYLLDERATNSSQAQKSSPPENQEHTHPFSVSTMQTEDDFLVGLPLEYPSSIAEALEQYSADRTGKPDFALESAGGAIVRATEGHKRDSDVTVMGLRICRFCGARAMIQSSVMPGECWAFEGSSGYAVIRLLGRVRVGGVSLEHISRKVSPTSDISSAPKEFSILGLDSGNDQHGELLGRFRYSDQGTTIQFFPIKDNGKSYRYVEFKTHSNHGNPDYTCVYRLRVHGSLEEI